MTNPKELTRIVQAKLEEHKKGKLYTPEQKLAIIDALNTYPDECKTMPTLAGFGVRYNILTETISNWPEAAEALKTFKQKQEEYILRKLETDKQPIRWIYLAKAVLRLYDTPQPQDTQQDSMTITLTGQPSGKLVDAMAKFTQRNKQMNG